jgi:hypothetical protein
MRSTFFEGLLYLELLEIYDSSSLVGELYFLSQSNVYRAAMSLSAALPSLGGRSPNQVPPAWPPDLVEYRHTTNKGPQCCG